MKNIKLSKQFKKLIEEYFKEHHSSKRFVPGVSRIGYSGRVFDTQEIEYLVEAALEFWLTSGRFTNFFERSIAKFLGVRHCVFVNSGSSANLIAISVLTSPLLKERRLRPGDEIITTACGFPTTLNPIIQNRLVPVFIDIDLGNYNIKISEIEKAITKKTRAIFIAHTLGNPADLDGILKIARKYNLWVIEDNCDALGSEYKGRKTGSFGDISTLSFYPAHHITTGEGGAVLTNDPLLRRIIMSLRDWGRDCWCNAGTDNTCNNRFTQKIGKLPYGYDHKYVYSHVGYNFKATDLQAAIGCAQLKKLPTFINDRRNNFSYLKKRFKKYAQYFILPEAGHRSRPSWFGFPILVKESAPFNRKQIVDYLEDGKITTRMLFGGNLARQPAYNEFKFRKPGGLKNTDIVVNRLFWLGVYSRITKSELDYIIDRIEEFIQKIKLKKH